MINHDSDLGNMHGFRFKVVNVFGKHFNQSLINGKTCLGAKDEKWQPERIHTEIFLDAIHGFVEAENFANNPFFIVGTVPDNVETQLSHPFYWSAFILIGNGL
ncbi:hypothetical protein [Pseudanabaena sp. ABRG5-3]|uniref:hypothetical protein n=1 Tax=Pseudanabaena sp. ABRG5-3 TaxID=685565 RepID=UPI000DC71842|nr:hypothetical protein [Pseudanabaena sp. ABRG5-3]BBC26641.1 hypothetical protein ABRG53_a067 [Pseudanabaena sp. ABRG5-3]